MSPRRVAGSLVVLAVSLLGVAAVPGALPAAEAVTGSPPVTTPDAVTVYTGNVATLQPVNNDHDPDNDQLALCRVGDAEVPGLLVESQGNDVAVLAKRRATPGTYTITYYACDFSYLTPGTITVTVAKLPSVKVTKVAGHPGRLRVKNPADFSIRLLYGGRDENRPDGSIGVPAHSSKVFTVHRTEIVWIAFSRDRELLLGIGRVHDIVLGPGGSHGRADRLPLSAKELQAWRAA